MDWKNEAGLPIRTGLFSSFDHRDDDPFEFSPSELEVTVLDEAGKKVGILAQTGQIAEFRLILPPSTYRLQIPPADVFEVKGYIWNAPETVQVEADGMTTVVVRPRRPSVNL